MIDKVRGAINGILINRLVIAVAGAVGGVFAATFPNFTAAFCGG